MINQIGHQEIELTLTLNLSEYVKHVLEYHNGNSTQNDAFGGCK
jgi:hypothetical protein